MFLYIVHKNNINNCLRYWEPPFHLLLHWYCCEWHFHPGSLPQPWRTSQGWFWEWTQQESHAGGLWEVGNRHLSVHLEEGQVVLAEQMHEMSVERAHAAADLVSLEEFCSEFYARRDTGQPVLWKRLLHCFFPGLQATSAAADSVPLPCRLLGPCLYCFLGSTSAEQCVLYWLSCSHLPLLTRV